MTTQLLIDQYITQAEEAEKAQEEAKQQQRTEFLEKAEGAIAEALGELWDAFKPHLQKTVVNQRGQAVLCYISGDGLDELELSPFWIHYSACHRSRVYLHWSEYPSGTQSPCTTEAIGAFLAGRRQVYHKAREERRQKEIENLTSQLRGCGAKKPDKANAALARLIELAPEQEAEWLHAREQWQTWYEGCQRRDARMERLGRLAAEYEADYAEYWQMHLEVVAANKKRLAGVQEDLDRFFQVWKLEYAIIAAEDGQPYVDTCSVYVADPEADDGGRWWVFGHGEITRKRFVHEVSLEGPFVTRPTDDRYLVRGKVAERSDQDVWIGEVCYNPAVVTRAEVGEMINIAMLPYPVPPPAPDDLDLQRIDDVKYRVESRREQ